MIKAIFFDFDGVLTTDATGTASIMNYIENHTSVDRPSFEKAYRQFNNDLLYGKTTHVDVWPIICENYGEVLDIQILSDAFKATPIDFEMSNLAKDLKQKGYQIGMITDNKTDRIHAILDDFDFGFSYDAIAISAEIGSGKKSHDIFTYALSRLSLEGDECIFIDNSRENLIVPDTLGMKTIFYDHEKRDIEGLKKLLQEYGISV